jgi:hypothetical protein
MENLKFLRRGDLNLGTAFWTWAVLGGLLVNVTTSILFFGLVLNDFLWLALIVGYGISVPYNVVATVGVWRSAARHDAPDLRADFARVAVVLLMTLLSLT